MHTYIHIQIIENKVNIFFLIKKKTKQNKIEQNTQAPFDNMKPFRAL